MVLHSRTARGRATSAHMVRNNDAPCITRALVIRHAILPRILSPLSLMQQRSH